MFFGKTLFSQNTIDGRDVNIASHMVCQQVVLLLLVGSVVKGLLLLQLAGIGLQQVVNEGLVVQYAMYIDAMQRRSTQKPSWRPSLSCSRGDGVSNGVVAPMWIS